MPDEMHKLQKDPPEGSRKVIERELKRDAEKQREDKQRKPEAEDDKRSHRM